MLDLSITKRYYSSLTNEQLLQVANQEMSKLTEGAIGVLRDEFVSRGLDVTSFKKEQPATGDNASPDGPLSTPVLWQLAFDLKQAGHTAEEITAALLAKKVNPVTAAVLIRRLPSTGALDKDFEMLIDKCCSSVSAQAYGGVLFLLLVAIYFFYFTVVNTFVLALLPTLIFAAGAIYLIRGRKGDLRGAQFWLDTIAQHPEKIVWIKPVVEKHTMGYVFTLYKERKFQLLTSDGLHILLNCDSVKDQDIFFKGVTIHLPHAQVGYNQQVDSLYDADPEKFLSAIQRSSLYTPIDRLV